MRARIWIFLLFFNVMLCTFPGGALAFGGYLTNTYSQIAPAEVKAFISYDGMYETITASQTFNFNPLVSWNFMWLIAVPAKPEVTFLKDDSFFVPWDRMTQKKFTKDSWLKKILYIDIAEENAIPEDTFSRPIDFIQYKYFPPRNQYKNLMTWLGSFGYVMPKTSVELVKEYGRRGWYLLAVEVNGNHIQYEASDSLTVKAAHTLPIQVRFKSDRLVFPMKLISMQPDIDSVAVPIGYAYGSKSTEILGVSDHEIDALTATQSALRYPHLPLELSPVKIDLFVLDRHRTMIKNFTTSYADRISFQNKHGYLTRLFTYRPMSQMQDLTIARAPQDTRINPHLSMFEKLTRIAAGIALLYLLYKVIRYEAYIHRKHH